MARVGLEAQDLEQRQREPGGLAGAGLGSAQKVFAGEDDGDGLRLDGGGLCVALFRDSAEQLRAKPERIERIANWNFSCSACEGLAFDRFRQMLFRLVFERSRMDR
jgi:hypothetical protein